MEAGDEEPIIADVPGLQSLLRQSSIDYDYRTGPNGNACISTNRSCTWARGKVMGGTSVLNSMEYVRGNSWDYDNWVNLGNPGWSWKNVLPYFKKSENMRIPEVSFQKPVLKSLRK